MDSNIILDLKCKFCLAFANVNPCYSSFSLKDEDGLHNNYINKIECYL